MIRKEAWLFGRTSSGVRLYWELEESEGPKGGMGESVIGEVEGLKRKKALSVSLSIYFRNKAFVFRDFLNTSGIFKKQDVRFREFLHI